MSAPKAPKRKVLAATTGGISGLVVADFGNWCVNQLWFSPDDSPAPVTAFVTGAIVTAFTFVAGYLVPSETAE